MAYWVKRIQLKSGQLVTERELRKDENFSNADAPVVGDIIEVSFNGRTFLADVIWGNWPGRNEQRDPGTVVPIRVREI